VAEEKERKLLEGVKIDRRKRIREVWTTWIFVEREESRLKVFWYGSWKKEMECSLYDSSRVSDSRKKFVV